MLYKKQLTKPSNQKLWDQAKAEAKKRFKVFPSAYSTLWANRWYKTHGGEWLKSETDSRFADSKTTTTTSDANMQNRTPLESFETYVDDSNNDDDTEKAEDSVVTEKTGKKETHKWVREPWVDISRPVIDEAGNVIGFHRVGLNTRDIDTARDGYRTSYPKIMPRSQAMQLNAIEREELIRRNNNRYNEGARSHDSANHDSSPEFEDTE